MENPQEMKDEDTVSFADLIRGYQREGYGTRESIELAYSHEYQPKIKKAIKKKIAKMDK